MIMYDSVDISQIPSDAEAVAAYCDGRYANVAEARDRFPRAHILTIAVFAQHDADALDIETWDAAPGDAAGWYARQKARGAARPCLYASASVMQSAVLPALEAAGITRSSVRLWSAHYSLGEHICGPGTCQALSISADGTQWTDRALGRNLDQSVLLPGFFSVPVPPPDPGWTAAMISDLPVVQQGDTGEAVRTAQGLCVARRHQIAVDGDFGPATHAAVTAIQSAARVAADGVVGPVTWPVLAGVWKQS